MKEFSSSMVNWGWFLIRNFQFQIWTRNDNEFCIGTKIEERKKKILIASGFPSFQISFNHSMLLPFCAFSSVKWHKNFRNILKNKNVNKNQFYRWNVAHWKCDIHQGSLARFASLLFHWFPSNRFFYCACPFCARYFWGWFVILNDF